jgi:hypothetical protein
MLISWIVQIAVLHKSFVRVAYRLIIGWFVLGFLLADVIIFLLTCVCALCMSGCKVLMHVKKLWEFDFGFLFVLFLGYSS